MSRAPTRNSNGNEPIRARPQAAALNMQRRRFLQLGSAALGGALALPRTARGSRRARVVVIGGGFAGASCALHLRRLDARLEVSLIEPEQPYVSCPLSNQVLAGLRDLASISISPAGLRRAGVRCLRDRVDVIDPERRRLRLAGGAVLPYDRLVVAAGIRFLWGTPEGYDEAAAERMPHAWKAGTQTMQLAAQLRAMDDGGVVAISVPLPPLRCPPGPYERASLIAYYLKRHKPRSKILIFDSNNQFPKQDLFSDAWQALYPGMIEWIPVTQGGAVQRVEPAQLQLHCARGAQRVAVANIIPPQAPALLAVEAGLASGRGWCPVDPRSFESTLIANVHVIGDACIAGAMPKSATAANSQARQCALAIDALLDGRDPPQPLLHNRCYSLIAPRYAISIGGDYQLSDGELRARAGSSELSPVEATPELRAREAENAEAWYRSIRADAFGV